MGDKDFGTIVYYPALDRFNKKNKMQNSVKILSPILWPSKACDTFQIAQFSISVNLLETKRFTFKILILVISFCTTHSYPYISITFGTITGWLQILTN